MNRTEVLQKREARAKLANQAQELANKTGVTAEERQLVNRMLDDVDSMGVEIAKMEADLGLDDRLNRLNRESRSAGAPPHTPMGGDSPEVTKEAQDRQHRAWTNAMKYGLAPKMTSQGKRIVGCSAEDRQILMEGMSSDLAASAGAPEARSLTFQERGELRDMGGGGQGAYPGATSGFFIPVGFVNRVETALKYYGPMLNGGVGYPEIFDTAIGNPLPFPTSDDTSTVGELVGEGVQVASADVTMSQIMLGAYKYSSKLIKVSLELLQDSAFDLESFLATRFAIRLGRILNTHFTTGTGSSQPKGIVTASALGYTAVGSNSNDGLGGGANTIGSDDLIKLEHSVDIMYRNGAMYMAHDSTIRDLKTLKDKYGRPLWLPGLAAGTPDTINGYAYLTNNDMDTAQSSGPNSPPTTKKTMLFGQLSKYMIRRVKDMQVLRLEERYADYGQVAFLAFVRYDGNLLDAGTHPVKYLANTY